MAIETCDICGEKIEVNTSNNAPDSCPACFNPWTPMDNNQSELKTDEKHQDISQSPLIIICQKTGKKIKIPVATTVILGREAHGAEVLTQSQISRKHCLIEWDDTSGFLISDMGSTHGTYLGINRYDCSKNQKQPLINGEILFLGREIYTIKIESVTNRQLNQNETVQESSTLPPEPTAKEDIKTEEINDKEISCQCDECNLSFELTDEMRKNPECPECGCFNLNWINQ